MNVAVYTEPTPTGFRASTGAPLSLSAEGPTEAAAVDTVRALLAQKWLAGGRVHQLTFDPDRVFAAWDTLANDPKWDEHVAAIAEYRRQREEEELRQIEEQEGTSE